ncbi:AAA family ATPase, partial [Vibrio atlanticus]|uniref:AAA family ATPase n=1 Tax=Vibrio atlanticus TaxID=693153 RepID=UPI00355135FD
ILNRNFLEVYTKSLRLCLGRKCKFTSPVEVIKNYEHYSSGQKILIKMVTDFLSSVDIDDIVLIDEPETYLHPQGVSNFYHCILEMLEHTKSYCILATHSPIIIQETPSKYIQILSYKYDKTQVSKPRVETLGQGISTITNDVFKVEIEDLNFFDTLNKFSKLNLSLDELEAELGNKLDFKAKTYYLSILG